MKKRLLCIMVSAVLILNTGLTALAGEISVPAAENPGGIEEILESMGDQEGFSVIVEEMESEERETSVSEETGISQEDEWIAPEDMESEAFLPENGETQSEETEIRSEEETFLQDTEVQTEEEEFVETEVSAESEVTEEGTLDKKDDGAAKSGTCGSNLKWKISGTKLTITGKGEMTNWSRGCDSSYPGWYDYRASITEISIHTSMVPFPVPSISTQK